MVGSMQGILHQYTSRLTAFEHISNPTESPSQNVIIFIGGLTDGLLTVPYTTPLASSLPSTWSLATVLLSSSYNQFGTCDLQSDVLEISKCVSFFRRIKSGKVVLMGHSTGCQDVLEYLAGSGHGKRSPIDGAIVQASVSDREAVVTMAGEETFNSLCEVARKMVEEGEADAIVPLKYTATFFPPKAPITAKRFLSFLSPNHDGDDDFFSSDLTDEQLGKTFGALPERSPLCILLSGADEYMPKTLDKKALVDRWIESVKKGKGKVDEAHSGIVEGASHNLKGNDELVVKDLIDRVTGFLSNLNEHPHL